MIAGRIGLIFCCISIASSCRGGGCDGTAVTVVEEIEKLAGTVESVEVLQDSNQNGIFETTERVFVVNPAPSIDKIVKIRFWDTDDNPAPPRSAFGPLAANPFLEISSLPPREILIDGVYFDEEMTAQPFDDTPATIVIFDISDDLLDPDVVSQVLVALILNLNELDPALEVSKFNFVIAKAPTPSGLPPRISSFSPQLPDMPGWSRPIQLSDFGRDEDLLDVLARAEATNYLGTSARERVYPHEPITFQFDKGMTNFVVSTDPRDSVGFRPDANFSGIFNPFDKVVSDSADGLVPDQEYRFTPLSRYSLANSPMGSGSQSETGLFLIPNMTKAVYQEMLDQGFSRDDLGMALSFTIRTGPLRIQQPRHKSGLAVQNTAQGLVDVSIEYAAPNDLPALAELLVSAEFEGQFSASTFSYSPAPIIISQLEESKPAFMTKATVRLPASGFDGKVILSVTGTSSTNSGDNFVAFDEVSFNYDSIVPVIDNTSITVTNNNPDQRLEELCFRSDCDLDAVILQVPGGSEVTLDASDAETTDCVDSQQTYCFGPVSLGLPDGATDAGTTEVSLTTIDDQGNVSDTITFTTTPTCSRIDKFVDDSGASPLVKTVTLSDGKPAVAWIDGRRLKFASVSEDGSWTEGLEVIHTLDLADEDSVSRFGLGFDMTIDEETGEPAICYVDARIDRSRADITSVGTLKVVRRDASGQWVERASVDGVRPLGCTLTNYPGPFLSQTLVVGWVIPEPGSTEIINGIGQWGRVYDLFGLIAHGTIPRGDDFLPDHIPRGLKLAGSDEALFFTFATSRNDVSTFASSRLTNVIVGYFDQAHPDGDSREMSGRGANPDLLVAGEDVFVTSISEFADDDILNDRIGVQVFSLPTEIPDSGRTPNLTHVLSTPVPMNPVRVDKDRVTFQPDTDDPPIVSYYGSPPALAASPDAETIYLAFAQTDGKPGGETLAVYSHNRESRTTSVDIVDARVGSVTPGDGIIAPSLASGPNGFYVAFVQAGAVVFASEIETILFESASDERRLCTGYRTAPAQISEDQLNLRLGGGEWLTSKACETDFAKAGFGELRELIYDFVLKLPMKGIERFPNSTDRDLFGMADDYHGLVDEILTGVVVEDGRVARKVQPNVCVPNVDSSMANNGDMACDADIGGNDQFRPIVETLTDSSVWPRTEAPEDVGAGAFIQYDTIEEAIVECPGQVVFDLLNNCVVCPEDTVYDPPTQRCVQCDSGASLLYVRGAVSVGRPDILQVFDKVECRACQPVVGDDEDRGTMDWLLSADGTQCSRCTNGSQQAECRKDEDCDVLGDNDYRCAQPAEWFGRANAPTSAVCVKKCSSDDDCAAGSCDTTDRDERNGPDGICRLGDANATDLEQAGGAVIAGGELACRPIGCDRCFKNDYCNVANNYNFDTENTDCPYNHSCKSEPTLSPMCVARPILSPWKQSDSLNFIPDEEQREDAEVALNELLGPARAQAEAAAGLLRLPDTVFLGRFIKTDWLLTSLTAEITEVSLSANREDRYAQGAVTMTIDFKEASGRLESEILDTGFAINDMKVTLTFVPSLLPSTQDGAYADISMSLVDVDLDADLLNVPDFITSGWKRLFAFIFLEILKTVWQPNLSLGGAVSGNGGSVLTGILALVGSMNDDGSPGFTRCVFVANDDPGTAELPLECSASGEFETSELVEIEDGRIDLTLKECR